MEFDQACRTAGEPALAGKEELYDLLLWLSRYRRHLGGKKETARKADGPNRRILVRLFGGNRPVPGKLLVFPVSGGSDGRKLEDRIPAQRLLCGRDGRAELFLPEGRWRVTAAHGVGYTKESREILTDGTGEEQWEVRLTPLGRMAADWHGGELHHHSIYSSPAYGGTDAVVETPAEVKDAMLAAGCEFGALSDHHHTKNHAVWKQQKSEGFCPVISKEISTSNGHVMALGVDKDVIYEIPCGKARTADRLRQEFIRTAETIRREGGIAQINHPFDTSVSTSFPAEFEDLYPLFDSMEIWNGAHPMLEQNGNGKAVKQWLSLRRKGVWISAVSGSDTHQIRADQYDEDLREAVSLLSWIGQEAAEVPEGIREKLEILRRMGKRSLPHFLEWNAAFLGTACVKTYVKTAGELTQESLLEGIRNGDCMVTDGPLLFPEAGGFRVLWEEKPETLVFFDGEGRERRIKAADWVQTDNREYGAQLPEKDLVEGPWEALLLAGGRLRAAACGRTKLE